MSLSLEDIEKDIASVMKAIEQSIANHNILLGQLQGLQHVQGKLKSTVDCVAGVADTVEKVVDAIPETPVQPSTQENPA